MPRRKRTRRFGGLIYHYYTFFNAKYGALKEADRLRRTGKWNVRVVIEKDGYSLWTRPK